MDEIFMQHKVYNPFLRVEEILNKFNHIDFDGIILDFHKEVSSS
jgi:calcineurin-like phosphoesterase